MASARLASNYEHMAINKDGVVVDFTNLDNRITIVNFSYYESLLEPFITANVVYTDLGAAVKANSKQDTSERFGTLANALPITGNEDFEFKITGKLGTLDFVNYPLKIVRPPTTPTDQDSLRTSAFLSLASEYSIKNENTRIFKKYYNSIGNSVESILKNELGIPSDKLTIEQTKNSYAFTGSNSTPFALVQSICSKSVPVNGAPGFFFWESQNGFNFRSIDSLISAEPVATYKSYGVAKASFNNDVNDYRIISYDVSKNQDILNSLAAGVYKTKNVFFDPYSFNYTEFYLSLSKAGLKNLGSSIQYPNEFDSATSFSRTHNFILDTGNNEVGVSTSVNNDPRQFVAQATMRYNLLFVQVSTILIPFNPNLKAGDVIICEFERTSFDNETKSSGEIDETKSGKFLIMHLCHSFDTISSYTSLTLVRDTYGIYTNGG